MWLCGRRRGRCALPGDGELVDGGVVWRGERDGEAGEGEEEIMRFVRLFVCL